MASYSGPRADRAATLRSTADETASASGDERAISDVRSDGKGRACEPGKAYDPAGGVGAEKRGMAGRPETGGAAEGAVDGKGVGAFTVMGAGA